MEEPEGREIWFLNRNILVVRPREPFVEWAMSTDNDGLVTPEWAGSWVTSFLLPQFEDDEEALFWISETCEVMFEMMLNEWILIPELWPEERGWEAFQRWFSFEHIEMAWDLVDGPLSSDPPPPPEPMVWDA